MSEELHAWSNGYDVVIATSEAHARDLLRAGRGHTAQTCDDDVDGDGWRMLADDYRALDEDGDRLPKTMGEYVREHGPGYLWSLEPR